MSSKDKLLNALKFAAGQTVYTCHDCMHFEINDRASHQECCKFHHYVLRNDVRNRSGLDVGGSPLHRMKDGCKILLEDDYRKPRPQLDADIDNDAIYCEDYEERRFSR